MTALRAVLTTLLLLATGPAATANALAPPPVDDRWLPAATPPTPPEPTVQRSACPVLTDAPATGPTQLSGLGLAAVWPLTRGAGVTVAVIDTGVAPHRQLPDLLPGGDYVTAGVPAGAAPGAPAGTAGAGEQDCDGHGTLVAGIIAARPDVAGAGFSGVAPAATVLSIRQSSTVYGPAADASRSGVGDVDTLAAAVRTAADRGAAVINISVVACLADGAGLDDRALGAALAYAVDVKDAVVVAAAGNTAGPGRCPAQPVDTTRARAPVAVSPAWYDDYVLAVGSVDPAGQPSTFTLAGPWLDVAAPGEAVVSLNPSGAGLVSVRPGPGGPEPLFGTSYAAPVVSGLAALIRARFPDWPARKVVQRIKQTAHPASAGWNPVVGRGVIDPLAAVSDGPGTPPGPPADPPAAVPTGPPMTAPAPAVPAPASPAPRVGVPPAAASTAPRVGGPPAAVVAPPAPILGEETGHRSALPRTAACLAVLAGVAAVWSWRNRTEGAGNIVGD